MPSNTLDTLLSAAQSLPGFGGSKPYAQVSHSEAGAPLYQPAPYCPSTQPTSYNPCDPKITPRHESLHKRFRKFRLWLKIAVALSHAISGLLSVFMEAIMFYVMYKHSTTKDLPTDGRPWGPWAKNTKLWPTYMLAAASVVTCLLSLGLLVVLCCRSKRKATTFSLIAVVIHVVIWAIVAALYRIGKTGDDLWGWSCSEKAQAIQSQFSLGTLNFDSLCSLQGSSWQVSIGEVGLKILTSGVSWYFNGQQNSLKAKIVGSIGSAAFDSFDF